MFGRSKANAFNPPIPWTDAAVPAHKRRSREAPRPRIGSEADESSAATALTASWMLSILTSLLCNVGAIAAHAAVGVWPDEPGVQLLAGFLLFGSVVVGVVTLALTPLVARSRRRPAPRPLVAGGVLLALAPLAAALMRLVQ